MFTNHQAAHVGETPRQLHRYRLGRAGAVAKENSADKSSVQP